VADLDEVVKRMAEGAMENLKELESRVGVLRVVLENEGREFDVGAARSLL